MAVYTIITEQDAKNILANYEIGEFSALTPIQEGIENTNYQLVTNIGKYILTIFEQRVSEADLPFFMALKLHLAHKGIKSPKPLVNKDSRIIGHVHGKSFAIISFLNGRQITDVNLEIALELGKNIALFHLATQDFSKFRKNNFSCEKWRELSEKTKNHADEFMPGLAKLMEEEINYLEQNWPKANLPKGVIHADLFPDNVFFLGGKISGLIDFYFAATDYYIYEIAICISSWCFDREHKFQQELADSLLAGYDNIRKISGEERSNLNICLRGAAMRFLTTRLYDWFFTPKDAIVTKKDPMEYVKKLEFYRDMRPF